MAFAHAGIHEGRATCPRCGTKIPHMADSRIPCMAGWAFRCAFEKGTNHDVGDFVAQASATTSKPAWAVLPKSWQAGQLAASARAGSVSAVSSRLEHERPGSSGRSSKGSQASHGWHERSIFSPALRQTPFKRRCGDAILLSPPVGWVTGAEEGCIALPRLGTLHEEWGLRHDLDIQVAACVESSEHTVPPDHKEATEGQWGKLIGLQTGVPCWHRIVATYVSASSRGKTVGREPLGSTAI